MWMLMKNSIKIVVGLVGFFSFSSQVAAGVPFAAARAAAAAVQFAYRSSKVAWEYGAPVARDIYRTAKPVIEELYVVSKPHIARVVELAKAHPDQAKSMAVGATLGYMTSDDGVLNTTVGTGLGAVAFLYPWARLAHARQAALVAEQATQLAKAEATISTLSATRAAGAGRAHEAGEVLKNAVVVHKGSAVSEVTLVKTQTFSELIGAKIAHVKNEIQGVRDTLRVLSLARQAPEAPLSQALYFAA